VAADVGELRVGGTLADVAPTILALVGEEQLGRGAARADDGHQIVKTERSGLTLERQQKT
jgi:hypothetical protein